MHINTTIENRSHLKRHRLLELKRNRRIPLSILSGIKVWGIRIDIIWDVCLLLFEYIYRKHIFSCTPFVRLLETHKMLYLFYIYIYKFIVIVHSGVAQRKRVRPITSRSAQLIIGPLWRIETSSR